MTIDERKPAATRRETRDDLALLVDFGSTFTKVTAVDLLGAKIIGRAQAPSTVDRDVCDGLQEALTRLHEVADIFDARPTSLDCLDGLFVRASSSAAGGLRIAVVGNVPGLTGEAGRAAALGAGGKIVGAFAFRLQPDDMAAIDRVKPDMILLAGGADGGDERTILHNAAALADSKIAAPVVIAGNAAAAARARDILADRSREVSCVANVMPAVGRMSPEAAREEIRRLFTAHITKAKGLDRLEGRLPVILPTPMAVHHAALLGAEGRPGAEGMLGSEGMGNLIVVDVGGATTDVHSIGEGPLQKPGLIVPTGLPEPFAKRTVEGDLGVRWNAATILERVGRAAFAAQFQRLFSDLEIGEADVLTYIDTVGTRTDIVPTRDWHFAVDMLLARIAVEIAIDRHAGRRKPYYCDGSTVYVQSGKDLTNFPIVIGTGGVFTYNRFAEQIVGPHILADETILRPASPRVVLDANYVLYSIGLLADTHPDVAMKLFRRHFASDASPPST